MVHKHLAGPWVWMQKAVCQKHLSSILKSAETAAATAHCAILGGIW